MGKAAVQQPPSPSPFLKTMYLILDKFLFADYTNDIAEIAIRFPVKGAPIADLALTCFPLFHFIF
jgi:hypothetical protein